jgi:hypothetical protein
MKNDFENKILNTILNELSFEIIKGTSYKEADITLGVPFMKHFCFIFDVKNEYLYVKSIK